MSDFLDALMSVPFWVTAAAVGLGLLCALLVYAAFVSIPDREVSDLDGWDRYTAERATVRHLAELRAEKIAKHYRNGRWQ